MNADEGRESGSRAVRGCLYALLGSALVVLVILTLWWLLRNYVGD